MGKDLPKLEDKDFKKRSNLDKYKVYKKEYDHRFGNISILTNPSNSDEKILAKVKVSNSEADATRDIYSARRRMALSHPH